jgi:SAM-dependent methyltransferase
MHEEQSASYYDSIASEYDRSMADPACVAARACFWHHAAEAIGSPGRILDFGAGTGIDAEHYASLGHLITAYEPSPGMIERLRARCSEPVGKGLIRPVAGSLNDLAKAVSDDPPYDLITSNFAVFTLIPDPRRVLELFGTLLRAGGIALINIQNPLDAGDLRTLAYWKAVFAYPRLGGLRFHSRQVGTLYRHTPGQLTRLAWPTFRRERVDLSKSSCCRQSFGAFSTFRLLALRRT